MGNHNYRKLCTTQGLTGDRNSASITINGSSINGSLDDHDVWMGVHFSDFGWDWTDGLTDRWGSGDSTSYFVASDVVYRIDGLVTISKILDLKYQTRTVWDHWDGCRACCGNRMGC